MIYRLELQDGTGVYRGEFAEFIERYTAVPRFHPEHKNRCRTLAYDETIHRQLEAKGIVYAHEFAPYICGFATKEQLFNWFPPEKLKLLAEEAGDRVVLAVYEADDYVASDHQAMFRRSTARRLMALRPDALNGEA